MLVIFDDNYTAVLVVRVWAYLQEYGNPESRTVGSIRFTIFS